MTTKTKKLIANLKEENARLTREVEKLRSTYEPIMIALKDAVIDEIESQVADMVDSRLDDAHISF
jgi:hypothetical protein